MNLQLPQRPNGTLNEQIRQLFTYIFQLVEQLNYRLEQIENDKKSTSSDLSYIHEQMNQITEKIGQFMADNEQGA